MITILILMIIPPLAMVMRNMVIRTNIWNTQVIAYLCLLLSRRNNLHEQENTLNVICLTTRPVTLRKGASLLALEGTLNKMSVSLTLTHLLKRPVGSGKTALTLELCKRLRKEYNIGKKSTVTPMLEIFYLSLHQQL